MAMTVESYQRFESQKLVGKCYPWLAPHQVHMKSTTIRRTLSAPDMSTRQTSAFNPKTEYLKFCKSINEDENNLDEKKEKTVKEFKFIGNITDDDKLSQVPDEIDSSQPSTSRVNTPDDDLMDNIQEIKEYLQKNGENSSLNSGSPVLRRNSFDENFDRVPSLPPPPRPTSAKHPYLDKLHRLSTFKDMLVFNAENFIKEKVPRIPEGMFEHHPIAKEVKSDAKVQSFHDEADILLPTRKTVVDGIENDDLVAKFISFLGWVMFLLMRMISLSVFAVFYLDICGWICLGHYIFMLLCLIHETRFKEKWQRTGFYFILSYIYIFNIMEFKIKFKNVRRWYVGYFLLVISQNIAMTVVWYKFTLFVNSWWFEFFFMVILQSGITSVMCFALYFVYLKPKEKVLFLNE